MLLTLDNMEYNIEELLKTVDEAWLFHLRIAINSEIKRRIDEEK